ncbi:MAG: magnesium/cobalt transporter CorA [Gemmatimonadota bacterium]
MSEIAPQSRIRCYSGDAGGVRFLRPDEAAALIRAAPATPPVTPPARGEAPFTWVDILGPRDADAAYLRDQLTMHPLAVEDCLRGRQRPKIDRYPGYFFVVFYAANINAERGRMALNEMHLFIGTTFIITVHDQPTPEIGEVIAAWRHNPARHVDSGSAAHAVLDAVTDNYFPVMEHFSNRLEEMEQRIFAGDADASMQQAIQFRHEMILLRRILAPQRDVLSSIVRRDLPFIHPELVPYFQDVHDHTLRVTEEIDAFRDLVTGLIEVQTSNAANRLNRTMQMLTGWSIILMSMGLIAGIYGMNFAYMPELEWSGGYFGALAMMVVVGVTLLGLFRRRDWL